MNQFSGIPGITGSRRHRLRRKNLIGNFLESLPKRGVSGNILNIASFGRSFGWNKSLDRIFKIVLIKEDVHG
jgi:hypothetical protein